MNNKLPFSCQYFDLSWLKELSFNDGKMLNSVVTSFISHLPDMLYNLQLAVNQGSASNLADAIHRVSSIASLFTRTDFSKNFIIIKSGENDQISAYTIDKVSTLIGELKVLLNEVVQYQKIESFSQKGIKTVHWNLLCDN